MLCVFFGKSLPFVILYSQPEGRGDGSLTIITHTIRLKTINEMTIKIFTKINSINYANALRANKYAICYYLTYEPF